jgi:hypothetical protein
VRARLAEEKSIVEEQRIAESAAVDDTPAQPQQMEVVIPEGSVPGTTIHVQTPAGAIIGVTIPEGYSAGMTMTVALDDTPVQPAAVDDTPTQSAASDDTLAQPAAVDDTPAQPQQMEVVIPEGSDPGTTIHYSCSDTSWCNHWSHHP